MKNKPSVSIITACYNSEKYVEETIRSVVNQTYTDWEWLIVDDCSTDNSVQLIEKFEDDRIKLIKLPENQDAAKARNAGMEQAQGKYIAFIDSDDLWLPDALEKRISFLQKENEVVVYTSYKRVNEELQPCLEDFIAEDNVTFKRLLKNCPIFISTLVYDSEKTGKIMFPDVYRREDYAMVLNLMKKTEKARAIQEALVVYRIRSNSYSRNKWLMFKLQFLVYFKFLKLPLHQSLYFTLQWAYNGLKKYGRI